MPALKQEDGKGGFYLVLAALLFEFGRPQDAIPGLGGIPIPSVLDGLILLNVLTSGKLSLANIQTRLWAPLLALMALHVPIATNNFWALMTLKDMMFYLCLYLGVITYVNTLERFKILVNMWLGVHVVLAIQGILHGGVGIGGWLGDENDFCMAINMAVPFAFFLVFRKTSGVQKVVYLAILCLFILTAMTTLSRGGFIGLAAVGFYAWLRSSKKGAALVVVGIVVAFMILFAPDKYWDEVRSTTSDETMEIGTGGERLYTWGIGWEMFVGNPILGIGQSNFAWTFAEYQGDRTFNDKSIAGRAAHSLYFTLLPELGLVGVAIFGLMMVQNFRDVAFVKRCEKASSDKVATGGMRVPPPVTDPFLLASACEASLIGYLVSSVFITTLYYPSVWVMTGFIVALANMAVESSSQSDGKTGNLRRKHSVAFPAWSRVSRAQSGKAVL